MSHAVTPIAEEWRPVPGFEGYYEASNTGLVRSLTRRVLGKNLTYRTIKGKVLKPRPGAYGYVRIGLSKAGEVHDMTVHKIVALTFIGPRPEGMDICHFDGNRTNNAVWNLRYDTRLGNMADQRRHGTHYKARRKSCARGHLLIEPNLVKHRQSAGPNRTCLACERVSVRAIKPEDEAEFLQKSNAMYLHIMALKVDYVAEMIGELKHENAMLRAELDQYRTNAA